MFVFPARVGLLPRLLTGLACGIALLAPVAVNADVPAAPSSVDVLLEKAQFWLDRGQDSVAIAAYRRALVADPTNIDALIGALRAELQAGHLDDAEKLEARLRQVSPNHPYLDSVAAILHRSPQQTALLAEARSLQNGGDKLGALAKYREMIGTGKIPDDITGEYYFALIATLDDGTVEREDAYTALDDVVKSRPTDLALKIDEARSMMLSPDHRSDAIDIYQAMAQLPTQRDRIQPLWRMAILWSGVDLKTRDQLDIYLQEFPSDPEIDARVAVMRTDLPKRTLLPLMLGNQAEEAGDLKTADAQFARALKIDPQDTDVLSMIAVLRFKQGRTAEGQALVNQAIALQPERKQKILAMVGQDPVANAKAADDAMRAFMVQYREVTRLTDAGQYAAAEALLKQLIGTSKEAGGYMQLAAIQSKAGHDEQAIDSLHHALDASPDLAEANFTLGIALNKAGKLDEAQPYLARAEAGFLRKNNPDGARQAREADADRLMKLAMRLSDPIARMAGLQAALARDPAGSWTRLALAHALVEAAKPDEAARMMLPVEKTAAAAGAPPSAVAEQAINAAFLWATERGDTARSGALAQSLPPEKRTPAMMARLEQVTLDRQLAAARGRSNEAAMLLSLAAHADPDGSRGALIGRALVRLNDVVALRAALAVGIVATPPPAVQTRLRYGWLLGDAHQYEAARSVVSVFNAADLADGQRRELARLYEALMVSEAEVALQGKQVARAETLAQPWLQQTPRSDAVQVVGARIAIARGHAADAMPVLQAVLRHDPRNADANSAIIDAAVALGDLSQADDLAHNAMQVLPTSPFLVMQAAAIARQRGRDGDALALLSKARELRAATQ